MISDSQLPSSQNKILAGLDLSAVAALLRYLLYLQHTGIST